MYTNFANFKIHLSSNKYTIKKYWKHNYLMLVMEKFIHELFDK